MKINGTSGYDAYMAAGKDKAAIKPPPKRPQAAGPHAAVVIAESADKYVDKVLATDPVDSTAVAEARKLLAEGLLDTPQAIDRAAQALVDRGL